MLMTPRVHCLGLIFFSMFIFVVHGRPAKVYFVTIIDEHFKAVLEGVTEETRKYMTTMINDMLGTQSRDLYYNTAKKSEGHPTFDFRRMMIRFVLQGSLRGTFDSGSISGSIYSLTDGEWKRWNAAGASSLNSEFVKTRNSWVGNWNRVTWWGVKDWKETHRESGIERPHRIIIPEEIYTLPFSVGPNAPEHHMPSDHSSGLVIPKSDSHLKQKGKQVNIDCAGLTIEVIPENKPLAIPLANLSSSSLQIKGFQVPIHKPGKLKPNAKITLFENAVDGLPMFPRPNQNAIPDTSGLQEASDPDPFFGYNPGDPYSLNLRGHQTDSHCADCMILG
ncbi:hypothetical protein BDP27DRAFT_1331081 [Rhodocollybia butyracea]|uniref:Uncharacterized protein n=1 Tax=Rhodocollybia butyracea TaxID=206335 RepID=A0A9P5PQB5_9AGAR|nr:hypothetical protein BDP27DRAFT_1331081 [Rhodocollybia butyracea]